MDGYLGVLKEMGGRAVTGIDLLSKMADADVDVDVDV